MAYDFSPFKKKTEETTDWLRRELSMLRTGRAAPAILDSVKVESYGSEMAVRELATVQIEDPRTIRITPWDQSQVRAIEKGIQSSGLGLSVSVDDKGLRIFFPELSSERRQSLVKVGREKLEEARITLRGEREKTKSDIEKKEKDRVIDEDDKFRLIDDLQKMVEECNKEFEKIFEHKEQEILNQ